MRTRCLLNLALLALTGSVFAQSTGKTQTTALDSWVRSTLNLPQMRSAKNEITPGYVLVKFRQDVAADLDALATKRTYKGDLPVQLPGAKYRNRIANTGWTVWTIDKSVDPKQYSAELMASGKVVHAQPMNRIYPLLAEPNDGDWSYMETGEPMIPLGEGASFRRLWSIDDMFAFEAWSDFPNTWYTAANRPSDSPIIAVIDTGCDLTHPDFINAGGSGTDVSQGGQLITAMSKRFTFGEIEPDGTVMDLQGHGTHVTGLALAAGNNGAYGGRGMIGTGYPCRGVILRVFDDTGYGSDADAAAAMFYAADNGIDIINMSLGTENYSQLFQDAVTYATQKGVLLLAAGNEDGAGGGDLGPIYPAACSGALAVTSNGPGYVHASDYYAGTGAYIDVAAPGGNAILDYSDIENPVAMFAYMYSTTPTYDHAIMYAVNGSPPVGYDLGYGYLPGTSMATPVTSGAVGLYYYKNGIRNGMGWDNLKATRAVQRSALGVYGAPKGSWEYHQGYGSLDIEGLLLDLDSRKATAGGMDGIVYLNGTATSNVTVRARKVGSATIFATTTQADGTYRFDQLPEGVFEVWAAPGGNEKRKKTFVIPGSDTTAMDFWCGSYTGDSTPPFIRPSIAMNLVANGSGYNLLLDQWAYDTETGIDRLDIKIGSKPGLADIMPSTEVVLLDRFLSVPVPGNSPGKYVTLTYTNGALLSSSVSQSLNSVVAYSASGVQVTTPSTVAPNSTFTATVTIRNTGSRQWTSSSVPRIALGTPTNRWGTNRVSLPVPVVRPGNEVTFTFVCTAPSTPGTYGFQWQMMQGNSYFGAPTTNRNITVQ